MLAEGEIGLSGAGGGPITEERREAVGDMLEAEVVVAAEILLRGETGTELRSGAIVEGEGRLEAMVIRSSHIHFSGLQGPWL